MKVNAVKCMECGDIIYSRTQHDFRECSCGGSFIDGGFVLVRFGGVCTDLFLFDIGSLTKEILYEDWNKRIDKYGLIKKNKSGKKE